MAAADSVKPLLFHVVAGGGFCCLVSPWLDFVVVNGSLVRIVVVIIDADILHGRTSSNR